MWLCRFVAETCWADREKYPAHILYQLLSGLLQFMREIGPNCPNVLEKKNHDFKELHSVLDNMSCQLRQEAIGAEVKHATLITAEEEKPCGTKGL